MIKTYCDRCETELVHDVQNTVVNPKVYNVAFNHRKVRITIRAHGQDVGHICLNCLKNIFKDGVEK